MTTCPTDRNLALKIVAMPADNNPYGTVFGGYILALIDQAGYVEARRISRNVTRWVTVALDRTEFKAPVYQGDVVSFYGCVTRVGTTSLTIRIEVDAERHTTNESVRVTESEITLVSVDDDSKPIPHRVGPLA